MNAIPSSPAAIPSFIAKEAGEVPREYQYRVITVFTPPGGETFSDRADAEFFARMTSKGLGFEIFEEVVNG